MNFFKTSRIYSFALILAVLGMLIWIISAGSRSDNRSYGTGQPVAAIPSVATSLAAASTTAERRAGEYGNLPLSFESNQGQTDQTVNFLARGQGYSLFLASTQATFVLAHHRGVKGEGRADKSPKVSATDIHTSEQKAVLRMQVIGGNDRAEVEGLEKLAGKVNYLIGNDPARWRTDVPTFSRVRYSAVYPGIDLVYGGNQRQLEYDFVIAPGADYRQVALNFDGAHDLEIETATGDLLMRVGKETIRQHKPFVYQEVAGERREIRSRYAFRTDGRVGFEVGEYDGQLPLVIDPVLVYSTYLGGTGGGNGTGIAVDSVGNAYVTGSTSSTDYPTANPIQAANAGPDDVVVTKMNAQGTALIYSTYLGGSGNDSGAGIALDSSGNAYIVGTTTSTNFPTANAIQSVFAGPFGSQLRGDAFVTKINAAGTALVYSTYLGGSEDTTQVTPGGTDVGSGIAVDVAGNAYVTGTTSSRNFPTANAFQATGAVDAFNDAFVTKINSAGTAFVYSSYLGGSSNETGSGITADSSGNAYVTGQTLSTNFPTANAFQSAYGGGSTGGTFGDAFLTKVNTGGSALVYSTYLGGSSSDSGVGVALDSSSNAYIVGSTSSTNFPTANPIQATNSGPEDIFVTKFNAAGSALVYSTYLGGSGRDFAGGIAVGTSGNAHITGDTASTNFPTANPFQPATAGTNDAFVTKLNAAGSALVYSTYLGGSDRDFGKGIAVDSAGDVYLTGTTSSTCFPTTTGAFDNTPNGVTFFIEAFVTKISETAAPGTIFACVPTPSPSPTPSPTASPSPTPSASPTPSPSGICVTPPAGMVVWYAGDGNTNDIQGPTFENASPGTGTSYVAGKVGPAFNVDSPDDAVTSASLNIGSSYSVDLWIRPATSNTADFQRVLGNTFNGTNFGTIYLVQNRIEYYQNGSNSLRVSSASGSVPFNTYTHVALTYDGSVSRLYINGNLAGTSSSHTEFYNNSVRIGYAYDSGGNSFFGQLDEVEIFNRVLSQSEISGIVAADSLGKCKPAVPSPTPTPPLSPGPSPTPVPIAAISCAADLTFGNSGRTTTDFPNGIDRASAVAVQSDGKILVAGVAGSDFALSRLNPDGSMDSSFGTGGRVYTDFFLGFDSAEAIVIQPDGKIVLAGSTVFASLNDFALARYNTDGSLDTGFGIGGKVTTDINQQEDIAYGVAIQSDGRIVVAGATGGTSGSSSNFGLARYNTNGSLDTTFGEGGRLVTDFGNDSEQASAVAIQSDGKIVATGNTVINNIDSNFALARYNTNGSLDTTFDTDGKVTTDFGSVDRANAVAIQADGKIVAAGHGAGGAGGLNGFAVSRYNTNGGLDTSFDGDGRITISTSGNVDTAEALVIQTDGKIVAAGWGGGGGAGLDFVAIRYNTNGSPDTSFDGDGKAATSFFNGDFAYGAALQADGKIVLAGDINTGSISGVPGAGTSSDFALLRYNTNGSLDTTFDGDGKVWLELFYSDDRVVGLGLQSTGKIIAAGGYGGIVFVFDAEDFNFQLARYNTNGQLDPTFGTAGRASTDFTNGSIDIPAAVAVLPDDRIVMAGLTRPDNGSFANDLALARYNPDGSLDSTFDGDGKVITDFSGGSDGANAMVIQPDGKIVIGGFAGSAAAFVRYNANGQLDNTFGSGGRAVITPAFSILSIALQPDGKIVAAGYTGGNGSDFALTRYNSNGSRDDGTANDSTPGDSFGTNGGVTTDFTGPSGFDIAYAVRLQADGKIVAAGDISIARYNTDGSLDLSFDGDGKATTTVSISALALQSDGKILGAGTSGGTLFTGQFTPLRDFALVRFNTNGQLDTSLCTGGPVASDFFGSVDRALSIIIQPDGKPVLGGYAFTGGTEDFALARYLTATPSSNVQFSAPAYSVTEDVSYTTVTVTRGGDTSAPASVDYATSDGTAIQRTDYTLRAGTMKFAAGETSKTFYVLISEDAYVEGNESLTITLSNPTGNATIGTPGTATLTIIDDDTTNPPVVNPIDDADIFVRQHYHDFLSREGDPGGIAYWTGEITRCGTDAQCLRQRRIGVSDAFFFEMEFQNTGSWLYRVYVESFGTVPLYNNYMPDRSRLIGGPGLGMRRSDFLDLFTQRAVFIAQYPLSFTPSQYVDTLNANTGNSLTPTQRNDLVNGLVAQTETRATVLGKIADNAAFVDREYNKSFVLSLYFDYLRRDAEAGGFDFWLAQINAAPIRNVAKQQALVCSFISAPEYQNRFSSVVTHTMAECPQ